MRGAQIQSLTRELSSHIPHGTAKKKEKVWKVTWLNTVIGTGPKSRVPPQNVEELKSLLHLFQSIYNDSPERARIWPYTGLAGVWGWGQDLGAGGTEAADGTVHSEGEQFLPWFLTKHNRQMGRREPNLFMGAPINMAELQVFRKGDG